MGILTAEEMCDEIRLALGNKTEADWPDAPNCERRLNESLLHIASPRVYRHKELEDTETTALVASQNSYTIDPMNSKRMLAIDSVVIVNPADPTDRRRLHPLREHEAHTISDKYSDEKPRWYSMWGATGVEVLPAPSAQYAGWTLSVRRIIVPTRFDLTTNPTDTSPLHEAWDEAIILGAVWRSWRTLKEWKLAEVTKAETGQLINEIADRMRVDAEDYDELVDLYNPGVQ